MRYLPTNIAAATPPSEAPVIRRLHGSAVEQGAVSLRVTWVVEGQTDLTWDRYGAEVSRRLTGESELRRSESSGESLLFVRTLSGDTHTLRIERLPQEKMHGCW